MPLHQTCLLIQCHSQTCLLVQCSSIRHACWVHLFRYTCLKSVSPSSKTSGMLQIHQTCLQVRCGSHGFATSLDAILNISNSERCIISCITGMLQFCNSRISQISILHANPWSLSASGKIILYYCNKLPFWRPFRLHSYPIFIFLLEAKCLQLHSNFIANNIREKMGLRHFSIPNNFFHL